MELSATALPPLPQLPPLPPLPPLCLGSAAAVPAEAPLGRVDQHQPRGRSLKPLREAPVDDGPLDRACVEGEPTGGFPLLRQINADFPPSMAAAVGAAGEVPAESKAKAESKGEAVAKQTRRALPPLRRVLQEMPEIELPAAAGPSAPLRADAKASPGMAILRDVCAMLRERARRVAECLAGIEKIPRQWQQMVTAGMHDVPEDKRTAMCLSHVADAQGLTLVCDARSEIPAFGRYRRSADASRVRYHIPAELVHLQVGAKYEDANAKAVLKQCQKLRDARKLAIQTLNAARRVIFDEPVAIAEWDEIGPDCARSDLRLLQAGWIVDLQLLCVARGRPIERLRSELIAQEGVRYFYKIAAYSLCPRTPGAKTSV